MTGFQYSGAKFELTTQVSNPHSHLNF